MKLKIFLQIFGLLAILLSLMPIIAADFWWIRVFDFPHLQLTGLTLLALIVYFVRFEFRSKRDYLFITVLACCFAFQFSKIYHYFAFAKKEVETATTAQAPGLKIFSANVLQKNTKYDSLKKQINAYDPDLIFLCETDSKWAKALTDLDKRYPYNLKAPLPNTYGLLFYSKFPLIEPQVVYAVDDSIPSVRTRFVLPQSQKDTIQLYAIHPTPPMPQHNPSSSDRDTEMLKVAHLSRTASLPVIVVGDFNDVPWAATTTLFKNTAMLLDPRVGRGFFNTFDSNNLLMRWPLDHLFVSEEFRVKRFKETAAIGSDHFPLFAELYFRPGTKIQQIPKHPSASQLERANEQIDSAKN